MTPSISSIQFFDRTMKSCAKKNGMMSRMAPATLTIYDNAIRKRHKRNYGEPASRGPMVGSLWTIGLLQ
jgi:hypothetical protein